MYIAICDDENACIEQLEKNLTLLNKEFYDLKWKTFKSSAEALTYYQRNGNKFDVLITDIEMPKINGVELANTIREKDSVVKIFFLTNYKEYAIQCFRAEPMNFWVKPVSIDTMRDDFIRVNNRITQEQEYINIKENRYTYNIRYRDIIYLKRSDRKTVIHTRTKDYYTNKSLNEYRKVLNDSSFSRVSQSFIINLRNVIEFNEQFVKMRYFEGSIPIGRTFLDNFKKNFLAYAERRLLK